MAQEEPIRRRLHLRSSPEAVYQYIATDTGRTRFWAEAAVERDGAIDWTFPNGLTGRSRVIEKVPPWRFVLEYFGGSRVTFELADDGDGGTDLTLTDAGASAADRLDVTAGWVSVLLALKAAVDFSIDLRNHDRERTWDEGFVDN